MISAKSWAGTWRNSSGSRGEQTGQAVAGHRSGVRHCYVAIRRHKPKCCSCSRTDACLRLPVAFATQTGATHRQAEPAGKPPDFSGRGGQRAPGGAAKRPIPQYPLYLRTPRASAALREQRLGKIIFARLSPNLTSGVLTGQAACYTITGRRDEVSAPGGGTTAAESRFGMIACASSRRAVTRVEYLFGDPSPTLPSTRCFATVDGKGVACPPLIVRSARHTLAIIVPLDWVP